MASRRQDNAQKTLQVFTPYKRAPRQSTRWRGLGKFWPLGEGRVARLLAKKRRLAPLQRDKL